MIVWCRNKTPHDGPHEWTQRGKTGITQTADCYGYPAEFQEPTAEQTLGILRAEPDVEAVLHVRRMLEAVVKASECIMQNHAALKSEVEQLHRKQITGTFGVPEELLSSPGAYSNAQKEHDELEAYVRDRLQKTLASWDKDFDEKILRGDGNGGIVVAIDLALPRTREQIKSGILKRTES